MYYYLTASYNTHDMCLDDSTQLRGPFATLMDRADALDKDMRERDLETSEIVNVTFLEVKDGKLISTFSEVVAEEDYSECPEEDNFDYEAAAEAEDEREAAKYEAARMAKIAENGPIDISDEEKRIRKLYGYSTFADVLMAELAKKKVED